MHFHAYAKIELGRGNGLVGVSSPVNLSEKHTETPGGKPATRLAVTQSNDPDCGRVCPANQSKKHNRNPWWKTSYKTRGRAVKRPRLAGVSVR